MPKEIEVVCRVSCGGQLRRIARVNGQLAAIDHAINHAHLSRASELLGGEPACACLIQIRNLKLRLQGDRLRHPHKITAEAAPREYAVRGGASPCFLSHPPKVVAEAVISCLTNNPEEDWPVHVCLVTSQDSGWYLSPFSELADMRGPLCFASWILAIRPSWYRTIFKTMPAVVGDRLITGIFDAKKFSQLDSFPGFTAVETVSVRPPKVLAQMSKDRKVLYYANGRLYTGAECNGKATVKVQGQKRRRGAIRKNTRGGSGAAADS